MVGGDWTDVELGLELSFLFLSRALGEQEGSSGSNRKKMREREKEGGMREERGRERLS
jgi:hypothetical protein